MIALQLTQQAGVDAVELRDLCNEQSIYYLILDEGTEDAAEKWGFRDGSTLTLTTSGILIGTGKGSISFHTGRNL